jgi:hypothetical protein
MGSSATDYSYSNKFNREAKKALKQQKRLAKRAEKAAERRAVLGRGGFGTIVPVSEGSGATTGLPTCDLATRS